MIRPLAFLLLWAGLAIAGPTASLAGLLSLEEFKALARDLAPKVTLFRDAWRQDPSAEFFGGSSRDFLYWIKGRLQSGVSPEALRSLPVIDVREFLIGESDADIVARAGSLSLSAADYGLPRLDWIEPERLDPKTPAGRSEREQGYIPVEKIRLGKNGILDTEGMGDGAAEIYHGRPTVHFTPEAVFRETDFAKQARNHRALLALRYLRILAMNYFQSEGRGFPDPAKLFDIDPESERTARRVLAGAIADGKLRSALGAGLAKKFDVTIGKGFRSYTNPTAALQLYRYFGADRLVEAHGDRLAPINQYLFAKQYDSEKVRRAMARYGLSARKLYTPAEELLPDLTLYHGTKQDDAYRAILFQGILPSESGLAGGGLYAVGTPHIDFAVRWAGSADRVAMTRLSPDARIIDITSGVGRALFHAFHGDYDAFAETFGADALYYPYDVPAFVVKNSAVLDRFEGYKRKLMPLGRLLDMAKAARTPEAQEKVLEAMDFNGLNTAEQAAVLEELPEGGFKESWKAIGAEHGALEYYGASMERRLRRVAVLLEKGRNAGGSSAADRLKLESLVNEMIRQLFRGDAKGRSLEAREAHARVLAKLLREDSERRWYLGLLEAHRVGTRKEYWDRCLKDSLVPLAFVASMNGLVQLAAWYTQLPRPFYGIWSATGGLAVVAALVETFRKGGAREHRREIARSLRMQKSYRELFERPAGCRDPLVSLGPR